MKTKDQNAIPDSRGNATGYSYAYDDIGNRLTASEPVTPGGSQFTATEYTANSLNQYTAIDDFIPTYDLDGNQTLVETSTGVWQVEYNGENRPVTWTRTNDNTVVTMDFDRMGRRTFYREMSGNTQVSFTRFFYDGYLMIQQLYSNAPYNLYKEFIWDPTEPVATKPLCFRQNSETAAFYTHDGNKNIADVITVGPSNAQVAHYEYAPFGAVTSATGTRASSNPYRFSSEFHDETVGLVYYNYRHYNPKDGRWTSRDPMGENNLYSYGNNGAEIDILGLLTFDESCKEIKTYCENEVKEIITELDKIAPRYIPPKAPVFDKKKGEPWQQYTERRRQWNQTKNIDPLWEAVLAIYMKRELISDAGVMLTTGIWDTPQDVRQNIQKIKKEMGPGKPTVTCCPEDKTGKLCGDPSTSSGYIHLENVGPADYKYRQHIIICPQAMSKEAMQSRHGGCGCMMLHELMHRNGMKIPTGKSSRKKYEKPIENAMIEIQRHILIDLKQRTCKGYDVQ